MSARRRRSSHPLPLAFAVASVLAAGPGAAPANAGPRTIAIQRKLQSMPIFRGLFGTPKGPKVLEVSSGTMTLQLPNQPVWAAFGKNDAQGAAKVLSVELGRQLARRGFMLATGGGKGLPKDTEDGAYAAGGATIAFSPKSSLDRHARSHDGNIGQTTHLVPTATGGGTGTIAREAPMAQAANRGVASFANGGSGTFGEFAAMLHNDGGVLVFLKGTGGVADAAPGWMHWVDAKPSFQSIAGSDAAALAAQARSALSTMSALKPGGRGTRTVELVSPRKAKPILSDKETRGRTVAAFLTDDPRASAADRERTDELMAAWAEQSKKLTGHPATLVVPADGQPGGMSATLTKLAISHGSRGIIVSPEGLAAAASSAELAAPVRVAHLSYGTAEMGKFAAAREVSMDAKVLFFTSARYNNLSALAYSLRDDRQPLIAVLANKSTHADKLAEMISVIDPEAQGRVIVASSPQALVEQVGARLRERAEKPTVSTPDKKAGLD